MKDDREENMRFIPIILFAFAFAFASGDKLGDAVKYMDEVLSVYVPWAVESAGLDLYEMPNFSLNSQNRSSDGAVTNIKVMYHSGNLTGLQTVNRKSCQEPSWSSGNISVVCNIVLPKIDVKYEGRFQAIKGLETGVHIRGHNFGVKMSIVDLEAEIEVTSSPHVKVPAVKRLSLVNQGKPSISFATVGDPIVNHSYEEMSGHFYHKYTNLFQELFQGAYQKALGRAVASVSYPEQQ
ncbi:hypothetical protein CDAR_33091 [Caerostris darwini]|uniref:Uncharacterized protein n=1 Tax=Caerostris darwini TaxID=1538125 RepID=A0AAV4SMN3_9ARAC|nr:hypothetical protein CDAR_33091 [Caerostris darwini]